MEEQRLSITLYLTPKCPLNCIYCFDDKRDCGSCIKEGSQEMNPEIAVSYLKTIIKNFNKFILNAKEPELNIHFFGGEPTLRMDTIKSVVEFLEKEKIDSNYWISTNGVTSEKNIMWMISKNFRFDICCDGPPKIHDKQRPFVKGNLKSSSYIERLISLLVKNKSKIRLKVVVTNETIKNMPEILEYLSKLGINHIRLEALLIDGRAITSKLKSVNPEEFVKYFFKAAKVARELSKKTKRKIYVSNWALRNLFSPRDYFCQFVRGNRIAITAEGKVTKCVRNLHSDYNSPFVVGKISENDLDLDKGKLERLKKLSVDKMSPCNKCNFKYICSGGCFNENYQSSGNFSEPNKVKCKIAKLMISQAFKEIKRIRG